MVTLQILCSCLASLEQWNLSIKATMHRGRKFWPLGTEKLILQAGQRSVGRFVLKRNTLGHNNVLERVSLHQGWLLRRVSLYSFFADPKTHSYKYYTVKLEMVRSGWSGFNLTTFPDHKIRNKVNVIVCFL